MNKAEFSQVFSEFARAVAQKFGRANLVCAASREVFSGRVTTFLAISEKPGRCVGYMTTRRVGAGIELVANEVFDVPIPPQFLSRELAAGYESAAEQKAIAVYEESPIHGRN